MPGLSLRGRSTAETGRNSLRDVKISPEGKGYKPQTTSRITGSGLNLRGLVSYRHSAGPSHPMERHSPAKAEFSPRGAKGRKIVEESFHEVMSNEPSTVERAKVSEKRKKKMRTAVALSKARERGVAIPKR